MPVPLFDTLGCSKRLQVLGIPSDQAEAFDLAQKDFTGRVVKDFVAEEDLTRLQMQLEAKIAEGQQKNAEAYRQLGAKIAEGQQKNAEAYRQLEAKIAEGQQKNAEAYRQLEAKIAESCWQLEAKIAKGNQELFCWIVMMFCLLIMIMFSILDFMKP